MNVYVLQLLQALLVVQKQLYPVFKLQDALLKFLPSAAAQGNLTRLHHDDLAIQQLVLLLEPFHIAHLLFQAELLLMTLYYFPLKALNGLALSLDFGLELQDLGPKDGLFPDGLFFFIYVKLLQFRDLLAQGFEIGFDCDHFLDKISFPVKLLGNGMRDIFFHAFDFDKQIVVGYLKCRVFFPEGSYMFGELLPGKCFDFDHLKFFVFEFVLVILLCVC